VPVFLSKASLFAFICLVRRGLWAAILELSLSFSTRSLMCHNDTAATSITISFMLPAVASRFFLSNILKACLGIKAGRLEPFSLAGMEHGGRDVAFARSHLIDDPWQPKRSVIAATGTSSSSQDTFLALSSKESF
jgi:hypothetical protein